MSVDPKSLVDSLVLAARFEGGGRELHVALDGGTLRYRRVTAMAITLGARIAAAEWVQDNLPQTIFSEHATDVARPEVPRGLVWLHGEAADFERGAIRDALSFTGGRWFRVFVAAAEVEVVGEDRQGD